MFKKGKTILYEGLEYEIVAVVAIDLIKLALKKQDVYSSTLLKKKIRNGDIIKGIAEWFIACKRITHGEIKSVREASVEKSTEVIRRLVELDNYELHLIIDVLNYALMDSFWKDVVLCITPLRVKRDGVSKFDKIRMSLLKSRKRQFRDRDEARTITEELE